MEKEDKVINLLKGKKTEVGNDEGVIKFKQNKSKAHLKTITRGLAVVLIASMSGAVAGAYIVEKKYGVKLGNSSRTIFEVIDSRSEATVSEENSVTRIVRKVAPSLVTISSKEKINSDEGNASGLIIKNNGYIITSYSSIRKFDKLFVKRYGYSNKPLEGKIVGKDEITDLAIVKVDESGLPVVKFGESEEVRAGDSVITLGNVVGDDYGGFATDGIITSSSKKIKVGKEQSADKKTFNVIQTTALINAQNSGGPLINSYGEIIGICSLCITKQYSYDGLGMAIGISDVSKILESIINFGEVKRISIGLDGATLKNKDIEGVYVQTITQNGSAANAGIRPTDIIIDLDGNKIKSLEDIINILDSHKVNDVISCKVLRGGEQKELSIKLSENK